VAVASRPQYSLVLPIFNEEQTIPELVRRLSQLIEKLDGEAEVILVDDGSSDSSYELMVAARETDPRFKLLRLSRNFGHQVAVTAGLDVASGDAVIVMDSDLQDPPEVALDVPLDVGDFRLVDRRALDAFRSMRESNRYVRGMFSWIGFRQVGVPFTREERFAGETKYPLRKMIKFATDGIVSFSAYPLRVALKLGFLVSAFSFVLGIVFLVSQLAGLYSVPGLASIAVFVAFLGGIQLLLIGIMGEYVARIHDEVKGRPLYLVSDARGLDEPGVR
jgi:glycosyltransferase involved in cell wall biosynthesis